MPPKPIADLGELLVLIQPLINAGCAFDIALPGGSFTARVVRYDTAMLHLYDAKGVHTAVMI